MLNKPQFHRWQLVALAGLFVYQASRAASLAEILLHFLVIILGFMIGVATLYGIYYWYSEE